uniref:Uncharacterized protein n=1 Tax=Rhizophora mucronata TaxID=61149 RepID=A0A2P2LFF1_RHIMU
MTGLTSVWLRHHKWDSIDFAKCPSRCFHLHKLKKKQAKIETQSHNGSNNTEK